jgi:hypothetical protein
MVGFSVRVAISVPQKANGGNGETALARAVLRNEMKAVFSFGKNCVQSSQLWKERSLIKRKSNNFPVSFVGLFLAESRAQKVATTEAAEKRGET